MSSPSTGTVLDAATPSPASIDAILGSRYWYHRMELTDGRSTGGKYGDNLVPVAHLMRPLSLDGMKCLDIGAMDGKMSFLMERLGGNVLAVDGVGKDTVPALARAYGSSVRYRSGVILEKLPDLLADEGYFDFVLCSGVAYHVYSPFDLIANVRALLKSSGLAIFETAALPDDARMTMALNRGDYYNEYTTLWIPTTACFRYMLRFLSMRVIGECQLRMNDYHVVRHAWLVQADQPSVLAGEVEDPWLATLLGGGAPGWSHAYLEPQLDLAALAARPRSGISAPVQSETPVFRLEQPEAFEEERALLATGTPAWRQLYPRS
jgi:2-polyprenyl-3-methyl-5-hydroxy-6-metoxy-1,4-benzoquinol methylase